MVILDYEINLSKTEFLYYQECPQKFRIHRILNPIPYPSTFMSTRRSKISYYQRNYEEKSREGIDYHAFFETFHQKYWTFITELPPPKIAVDNVKLFFWLHQQKKYYQNPDFWMPYATEFRLMTERQRGVIDCVELCSDKDGIRIIDYKKEPQTNDFQSLLFYANLVNDFREENKETDLFMFDVFEIGCYYYNLGEEEIFELNTKELQEFRNLLNQLLIDISQEKFLFKKSSCWNCGYVDVCKIEQLR